MLLTMSTPQLYSTLRAMETRRPRGWADAGARGSWRGTTGPSQCVLARPPSVTSLPVCSGQVATERRSLFLRPPDSGLACVLSTRNVGEVVGHIWGSALGALAASASPPLKPWAVWEKPRPVFWKARSCAAVLRCPASDFLPPRTSVPPPLPCIKCLPLSGNHEVIQFCR